jgi:hypothetical protein
VVSLRLFTGEESWAPPDMASAGSSRRRPEISFSHGPEWKAHINMYIGTIPLSADAFGAAAQSISSGLPPGTAVSSAMTAKVGAAARDSQSATPSMAAWSLMSLVLQIMSMHLPASEGFNTDCAGVLHG